MLSIHAQAAVIDNFASGNQAIFRESSWDSPPIRSEVPISDSLFESRFVSLSYGSSQSLTVTNSGQVLEYQVGLGEGGYFDISYRSRTPVNLLGAGATAFRFHFDGGYIDGERSSPRFPNNLALVTVAGRATSPLWGDRLRTATDENQGPFIIDAPFSEFIGAVDLTQVTELTFSGSRIFHRVGFRLTRIETIPEPSLVGIFLIGALPFFLKRSRIGKAP